MNKQHPSKSGETFKLFSSVLLSLGRVFKSEEGLYDGMMQFAQLINASAMSIYTQASDSGTSYFNCFACLLQKQSHEWVKMPLEAQEKQLIPPKLFQALNASTPNTYLSLSVEETSAFFPNVNVEGKFAILCLLEVESQHNSILGILLDRLEDALFEGVDLIEAFAQHLSQPLSYLLSRKNGLSSAHMAVLSAVFEALPDMKFRLNNDGRFLDYYPNGTDSDHHLLFPPEDFIGKTIAETMPPYLSSAIMKNLEKALATQTVQLIEYPLHINGQLLFYEARICAINQEEAIAIIRDITVLKQTQQKLEGKIKELNSKDDKLEAYTDANTQLEHFAHTVSHDLREPVRTMNSFAQLLLRRYGDKLDKDALEYLDFIVSGASHMNKMITSLLEFSSLNHEEDHNEEQIGIESIINITLASLNDLIQQTKAVIHIPDALPTVRGDKTKLHQLFQNLISNALKFRKKEVAPQIEIEVEEQEKHWLFSIRDNGIGIAPEHQDKIFVLFRKLHSKRVYPGSGIGLSICERVVAQHDGKLWVSSEPGVGSVFYFTIAK
jgi:signal transduction histidine kinase